MCFTKTLCFLGKAGNSTAGNWTSRTVSPTHAKLLAAEKECLIPWRCTASTTGCVWPPSAGGPQPDPSKPWNDFPTWTLNAFLRRSSGRQWVQSHDLDSLRIESSKCGEAFVTYQAFSFEKRWFRSLQQRLEENSSNRGWRTLAPGDGSWKTGHKSNCFCQTTSDDHASARSGGQGPGAWCWRALWKMAPQVRTGVAHRSRCRCGTLWDGDWESGFFFTIHGGFGVRRSAWGLGWIAYSSKLSLPTACARLSQAPEGAGLREWLEGAVSLEVDFI